MNEDTRKHVHPRHPISHEYAEDCGCRIAGGWTRKSLRYATPQQMTLILRSVSRRTKFIRQQSNRQDVTANNRTNARTAYNIAERTGGYLMRNQFVELMHDDAAITCIKVSLSSYARQLDRQGLDFTETLATLRHVRNEWPVI